MFFSAGCPKLSEATASFCAGLGGSARLDVVSADLAGRLPDAPRRAARKGELNEAKNPSETTECMIGRNEFPCELDSP